MIEPWDGAPFTGAKLALIHGSSLIAILRDDMPGIPFPGHWDLPGGGREGDEAPAVCALREVREELGLAIPPERIAWARPYPAWNDAARLGWFLAAPLTRAEVAGIRFGDEGERWEAMPLHDFMRHVRGIPHMRARLGDFLAARG